MFQVSGEQPNDAGARQENNCYLLANQREKLPDRWTDFSKTGKK